MVTSNKVVDKKVVTMTDQNNGVIPPPRTLLGEVNSYLTCYLCRGYYIDATTIVECLHSFCRSCIIKHLQIKSYCPVCEMMINSARPNIKPDKALQDIVYKLVPGLFQKEMERRQQFYSSRPGPAASATPEQRGEDTERIIFSPEDVISFSLEYADITDTDSVSSKSSESSNESPANGPPTRRYLQCPAVVNISHLKKFLSMKFDIDCSQFTIDILYKRVPLPDYHTLMDIAYIYNWKRNEPMRFFYQIIDYAAMRSRYGLFDINRKGSHFRDRKPSPTPTEDTNASSPPAPLNEPSSGASSGSNSPMPDDGNNSMSSKQSYDTTKLHDTSLSNKTTVGNVVDINKSIVKSSDEDEQKSQFLISIELTAKNSSGSSKSASPSKAVNEDEEKVTLDKPEKEVAPSFVKSSLPDNTPKSDELAVKRKQGQLSEAPDIKKAKLDKQEKSKLENIKIKSPIAPKANLPSKVLPTKVIEKKEEPSVQNQSLKPASPNFIVPVSSMQTPKETVKNENQSSNFLKQPLQDQQSLKRPIPSSPGAKSSKRLTPDVPSSPVTVQSLHSVVSPAKSDSNLPVAKNGDSPKPTLKKIPELKLNIPPNSSQSLGNKGQLPNKGLRMDLLANNSDPTMDRRKILSQVKSSLGAQSPGQMSGNPLKSLFDSCKINIPSSLSITLTDQKIDQRHPGDAGNLSDQKKVPFNKNNTVNGATSLNPHKIPSPPVHNYIEILKLPDVDPKKSTRTDANPLLKPMQVNKTTETTSAKGPVPSLKPISDTKLGKQSGSFTKPTTFQQTFLQSLQHTDKPKFPKGKMQMPKLMPAVPKPMVPLNTENKNPAPVNQGLLKSKPSTATSETKNVSSKSDSVLDLSTHTHTVQSQLGPQQTKALETMQSIANLAKKQNFPSKPTGMSQSNTFGTNANKSLSSGLVPAGVPSNSQNKSVKPGTLVSTQTSNPRPDLAIQSSKSNLIRQASNASPHSVSPNNNVAPNKSTSPAQPSPRSQTRSPSSSPKLVIAEEKQTIQTSGSDISVNQSNQISSSQISSTNAPKSEYQGLKSSPGPSKVLKGGKPQPNLAKLPGIRFPTGANVKPGTSASNTATSEMIQNQLIAQQMIQRQMAMRSITQMLPSAAQWIKMNQNQQYENLMKSISTNIHQPQHEYNNKDNK